MEYFTVEQLFLKGKWPSSALEAQPLKQAGLAGQGPKSWGKQRAQEWGQGVAKSGCSFFMWNPPILLSAVTPQRCLLKLFLSLPRSQCRIPEGRREQGRKQERHCVWGRKAECLGKEKGGPLWVESCPPERCVEILTPDACECDPIGNRDFTDVVRLR